MVWVLGRGGGMCRLLERMLGELPSAGGTGVQGSGVENGGCCHSMKKKKSRGMLLVTHALASLGMSAPAPSTFLSSKTLSYESNQPYKEKGGSVIQNDCGPQT